MSPSKRKKNYINEIYNANNMLGQYMFRPSIFFFFVTATVF